MPSKQFTKLKKIKVNSFRGLRDVNIEFADRLTVICGKNGTSKSTILGIVAQIFSFSRDYSNDTALRDYKTLTNKSFKSTFSEHFRFSEKFDKPGSMSVDIEVYDATVEKRLNNLSLALYQYKDRSKARPIVRGNDGIDGVNQSRNVTHPVIFLSLARLLPITQRSGYSTRNEDYINNNSNEIRIMNNQLLLKSTGSSVTATKGTIDSMVVHGDNYDHESVSVGEDNVGQIIQAIFSFKKLSEEYPNYRSGILLIDEADAGLFPAAQLELVNILVKEAKKYNLQIIITSHSPLIIENIYKRSKLDSKSFKTIYLTNTYGPITSKNNFSWPDINSDLLVQTVSNDEGISLPKVNIYFEDTEASDFFNQLIRSRSIRKVINPLKNINMSCSILLDLMARRVPEFVSKSIVVLDGDVENDKSHNARKAKKEANLSLLPNILPPDQMIFEFLYNLPDDDEYWKNKNMFTKPVFMRISQDIISRLNLGEAPIKLSEKIRELDGSRSDSGSPKVRDLFKKFAQSNEFKKMVSGPVKYNPYRYWVDANPDISYEYKYDFIKSLKYIMTYGHGIDSALISSFIDEG
ncbi:AAA family ATPase [Enterovibrio norvegicus]|uniref:AAA family ATPase n=1 Tax=Enterovibrio norvegicus TaxID=188144 RepID=UPI001E450C7C|nr:AAA family ATPase [Enterovibrio norvegicus]MCC4799063.1 AAA family ATPase [Enterovibrio norvegicus]